MHVSVFELFLLITRIELSIMQSAKFTTENGMVLVYQERSLDGSRRDHVRPKSTCRGFQLSSQIGP